MEKLPTGVTEEPWGRVELDRAKRVFHSANHDAALGVWQQWGANRRVLVHVDAHHDLWWRREGDPLSISNFISPALEQDIVREIIWVTPDGSWASASARAHLLRHVQEIVKGCPSAAHKLAVAPGEISADLLGRPLRVCSLDSMPELAEGVLLDIDVDFLTIPRASFGQYDEQSRLPWCWPEELLARLSGRKIRADLVTIADSVEGGYTPLRWKYLGDELAVRLRQSEHGGFELKGFAQMRSAAEAMERGDFAAAEEHYQEARRLLPGQAAPGYSLALLYNTMGRSEEARRFYREAVALEPAYRTAYASAGVWRYWQQRYEEAEREFRRVLALDSNDPYAHLGLGWVATKRKRWGEAETELRQALAADEQLLDAWRALGNVLSRQHRRKEAIAAYEASLRLALAGGKPLGDPRATDPTQRERFDPDHCRVYAQLARLYQQNGATEEAIKRYRISVAGGGTGIRSRARLAYLYGKQGRWRNAAQELQRASSALPLAAKRGARRLLRPLGQKWTRAYVTLRYFR